MLAPRSNNSTLINLPVSISLSAGRSQPGMPHLQHLSMAPNGLVDPATAWLAQTPSEAWDCGRPLHNQEVWRKASLGFDASGPLSVSQPQKHQQKTGRKSGTQWMIPSSPGPSARGLPSSQNDDHPMNINTQTPVIIHNHKPPWIGAWCNLKHKTKQYPIQPIQNS